MQLKKIIAISAIGALILTALGCGFFSNDFEEELGSYASKNHTLFLLTDDVNQDLSVLRIDITELILIDTNNQQYIIFSYAAGDEPITLNLLDLDGINALMGSLAVGRGIYKEIRLSYENAEALDNAGHVLTILPQHYGTAKVLFNPYLAVEEENNTLQIDFDLNNSVFNIVSKEKGSLMFMPTLIVKIQFSDDPEISEFKGKVTSVREMSMMVEQYGEIIKIDLDNNTVVEVDEVITFADGDGFDLTDLIFEGNLVEVYGTLDVASAIVTADRIERKFENHGLESQGIVTDIKDGSFDLLILNPRDSNFPLGSIQSFNYDNNTFFLYTDPNLAASADNLHLGQNVRVTGLSDNPNHAQKVKLKETRLIGTIDSIGGNFIFLTVAFIEGITIEKINNFVNPVKVEFNGTFPADITAGEGIKLEGYFNYNNPDVFTAFNYEPLKDEDDEDTSDGEGGDGHTWVGKYFSVSSSAPLKITLTRGNNKENNSNRTVTVIVTSNTVLFEKYKSETTMINSAGLINGINSGKYDKLKAEGVYDALANILTATKIRGGIKKSNIPSFLTRVK
jgi:hypothetical protein